MRGRVGGLSGSVWGVDSPHSKRRLNPIESYGSRMREVHPFDFLPYNCGEPMFTVVHVGMFLSSNVPEISQGPGCSERDSDPLAASRSHARPSDL